jgi:hypothetical protein
MSSVQADEIPKYAAALVEECNARDITARIMGAAAIRIHTHEFPNLHEDRIISDIDLMSYSKHERAIKSFMVERGFKAMPLYYGDGRQIYSNHHHVDVFINELNMCHVIDFRGRLELDYPTITVTDLLLAKMQIVQINDKDLKDAAVLLREHEVAETEIRESINGPYISRRMARDWGFYYTFTMNLRKLEDFSSAFLPAEHHQVVRTRIETLLDRIEKEPKSTGWRLRANIGTRKKWYQDVEEVVR